MEYSVIPHQIAVGSVENRRISLGQASRGIQEELPMVVKFDNSQYLVGKNVGNYEKPSAGFDTRRLMDGPDLPALTYASLANVLEPGKTEIVHVAVGLPVDVLQSQKAKQYITGVQKRIIGDHDFIVNDENYLVTIERATILPQPVGAYYEWGVNDLGKWGRSTVDSKAQVAICDIGWMSLDLFVTQGANIKYAHTRGCPGMRTAIQAVQKELEAQYQVHYEPSEIDEIMHGSGTLHISKGLIDVSGIVERARSEAANKMLSHMRETWGDGNRFPFMRIVGGGAIDIGDKIIAEYPSGVIPAKPVLANAIGLARFSRSIFEVGNVASLDLGQGNYKAVFLNG